MFGNPDTTPGGLALKFHASIRLELRRGSQIKDGTEILGSGVRVKVVKNKVAPPFKEAEYDVTFGKGISKEGNLLDIAVDMEFIQKSGSWFAYNSERIGQGRTNAKKYLEDNPDIAAEIEAKIRETLNLAPEPTAGAIPDDADPQDTE
jgi:recombination protein RecA